MGVDNLSFYDPSWIVVQVAVLGGMALIPLTILSIIYFIAKKVRPANQHLRSAKIALIFLWIAAVVAIAVIVFVMDIMQRPDLVPFITSM